MYAINVIDGSIWIMPESDSDKAALDAFMSTTPFLELMKWVETPANRARAGTVDLSDLDDKQVSALFHEWAKLSQSVTAAHSRRTSKGQPKNYVRRDKLLWPKVPLPVLRLETLSCTRPKSLALTGHPTSLLR